MYHVQRIKSTFKPIGGQYCGYKVFAHFSHLFGTWSKTEKLLCLSLPVADFCISLFPGSLCFVQEFSHTISYMSRPYLPCFAAETEVIQFLRSENPNGLLEHQACSAFYLPVHFWLSRDFFPHFHDT